MFGGSGVSLADIAAVTDNNKASGSGWGDGNGWWVLIILFALFGWGRGGYGNQDGSSGGGSGCGTQSVEAALQRGFDNQGVTNKLNGLENGLCSLGYDQLAQMNAIQNAIQQNGYSTQQAIQAQTIAAMQNQNALQSQIQSCCCGLEAQLAQANYQRAADTCSITTAISQASQAQIQNCNANYRALHDELVALQMQGKDEQIAQLQSALNRCDLRSSQAEQNAYLINALRPAPIPSYQVPNPYSYGCFGNNGCCCGNNNGWNTNF